jgi:hypothetical protein
MNDVVGTSPVETPVLASPPPRKSRRKIVRLAIVAAVVVALVSSGGIGTNDQAGSAAGGTLQRQTTQDQAAPEASAAPFRSVAGPADQVAELLRSKGIDARVANGRVEVRNASQREVNRALANRRTGSVEIVILN